ncbi:hypothetical protein ABZZ17_20820 [Streptomyces sp. NPDC006512]|uniref:hypothetical protein n=1 Tax=Streptomyces sp. NPDC006512 TaxID=3154307 RepID=UPI0033B6D2B8
MTGAEAALAERELGVSFPAAEHRTFLKEGKEPRAADVPARREESGGEHDVPVELLTLSSPHPDP